MCGSNSFDSLVLWEICSFLGKESLTLRLVFKGIDFLDEVRRLYHMRDINGLPPGDHERLLRLSDMFRINREIILWLAFKYPEYASIRQLGYVFDKYNLRRRSSSLTDIQQCNGIYKGNDDLHTIHLYVSKLYKSYYFGAFWDERREFSKDVVYKVLDEMSPRDILTKCAENRYNQKIVEEYINEKIDIDIVNLYKIRNNAEFRSHRAKDSEEEDSEEEGSEEGSYYSDDHLSAMFYGDETCFHELVYYEGSPMCLYSTQSKSMLVANEFARGMSNKKAKRKAIYLIRRGHNLLVSNVLYEDDFCSVPRRGIKDTVKVIKKMTHDPRDSQYSDYRLHRYNIIENAIDNNTGEYDLLDLFDAGMSVLMDIRTTSPYSLNKNKYSLFVRNVFCDNILSREILDDIDFIWLEWD